MIRGRSTILRSMVAPRVVNRAFSAANGKIIEIQNSAFGEVLQANGNKVLYFTATWCPPCRAIKPVYEKLSTEFPNIQFLKIDIDQNEKAAVDYKITSVPTFVFIAGNKAISQVYLISLSILYSSRVSSLQFSGASENALRSNLQELNKK